MERNLYVGRESSPLYMTCLHPHKTFLFCNQQFVYDETDKALSIIEICSTTFKNETCLGQSVQFFIPCPVKHYTDLK